MSIQIATAAAITYRAARPHASDGPTPLRARLHTDRALIAYRRDRQEAAEAEARRALKLAGDADDDLIRAQAHNVRMCATA